MKRLRTIALFVIALLAVLATGAWLIFQLPSFGGRFEGERLARMRQSKQFINGRFENTPPYVSDMSLIREIRSYFGDQVREPQFTVPVLPMAADALAKPVAPGLRTWWLGHASVLIELDGVRILTDPMLSQRASPFQFIGPARLHPAPLPLAQWTNIDAVVISHDHFDHLDMETIVLRRPGHWRASASLGRSRAADSRTGLVAASEHQRRDHSLHASPALFGAQADGQLHTVGVLDDQRTCTFSVFQRRHRLCGSLQGDRRALGRTAAGDHQSRCLRRQLAGHSYEPGSSHSGAT
jgi:beta-lactamase superfamily II metal-dependent hydrolase